MLNKFANGVFGFANNAKKTISSSSHGNYVSGIVKSLDKVPLHVSDGVKSVFNDITDYLKIAEIESTKRTDIIARRDVALQSIQSQRAIFEQLMKYTFQERASVINKQFQVLDNAMLNGDLATIKNALDGMVSVIQTSPFKSIQEMQKDLNSKDFVVRLE